MSNKNQYKQKLHKLDWFYILFILLLLSGCVSTPDSNLENNNQNTITTEDLITKQINEMSLTELIGQMFVIRLESLDKNFTPETIQKDYKKGVTTLTQEIISQYEKYPAGGFTIFDRNIRSPEQLQKLNNHIHTLGKIRPLIFIDEEGGIVTRVAKNPSFNLLNVGNMDSVAETKDTSKAYEIGAYIGKYLKEYDFDVNFAPIADVNTNPENPIIGKRAFGNNPELAAEMNKAYLEGLWAQGIKGCLKHYPGHGDTKTDTHKGYAETKKNWNELKECELITFQRGIDGGVEFIMTAHISAPNVTGKTEPATLSKILITEKLRNEMNYNGIIITDAMEMGAIQKEYGDEAAVVKAIEAGVDIILMPYDFEKAFDSVVTAVENGVITRQRIEESVRRILLFKNNLSKSK